MKWLLGLILEKLAEMATKQDRSDRKIDALITAFNTFKTTFDADIQEILTILRPPLPTNFAITLTNDQTGESVMAHPFKAALDFQLLDNGTAKATLSFVDGAGLPATLPAGATVSAPTWTVNPAGALSVTPAADGLSAAIAPPTPPALETGATITIGNAILTLASGTTSTITGLTTQGIDVISGGPAGFAVSIQ